MVMILIALLLTTIAIIYSLFFLTPTDDRSPPSLYFEYPMMLSSFIIANNTNTNTNVTTNNTTTANTTANTKKSAAVQ